MSRNSLSGIILVVFVFVSSAWAWVPPIDLDNGVYGSGGLEVTVQRLGGGILGTATVYPHGMTQGRDLIKEYRFLFDVGDPGDMFSLADTDTELAQYRSGDNEVTSKGSFQGEHGRIHWTSVNSIEKGKNLYVTRLTFRSDQPFGRLKLTPLLAPTNTAYGDPYYPWRVVNLGSPGAYDSHALMLHRSENWGVSQGALFGEMSGMTYLGWAAGNEFPIWRGIQEGNLKYASEGWIYQDQYNMEPIHEPRYPNNQVYEEKYPNTVMGFEFDPTAYFASITLYVGASPDGQPISVQAPERLRSPAHTKFNTFLGQWNFLELISAGPEGLHVGITLYSPAGQILSTTGVTLGGHSQQDIIINDLLTQGCRNNPAACAGLWDIDGNGVVDTYGLVRLDFDDSHVNKKLLGRMSNYRKNPGLDSYSFAFSRELKNPIRGRSYSASNTYDPQGRGFLVPNWAEIVNLDYYRSQRFTYNLYSRDGVLRRSERMELAPLGEHDVQAGHEILDAQGKVAEDVFLVEVIPDNPNADYLMYVSRYSSNAVGNDAPTYNFAFSLIGRNGASETLYSPITNENRDADCATSTNWVEVANVRETPVQATVKFFHQNGAQLGSQTETLPPKSQFHFNAGALLPKGVLGLAEVSSNLPNAVIAQSLVYYHDCQFNTVQTAYVTPAQPRGANLVYGTANTFLGMEDLLRVYRTTSDEVTAQISANSFLGGGGTILLNLGGSGALHQFNLNTHTQIGFPPDTYGVVRLSTEDSGKVAGQVLRVRRTYVGGRTRLDFIMGTPLR